MKLQLQLFTATSEILHGYISLLLLRLLYGQQNRYGIKVVYSPDESCQTAGQRLLAYTLLGYSSKRQYLNVDELRDNIYDTAFNLKLAIGMHICVCGCIFE